MYGLPADFDSTPFAGRELVQVSFSANTIHLSFDGDLGITLEGSFELRGGPTGAATRQSIPVESSSVMALVGKRVRAARHDGSNLTLEWEGGGQLTCIDDSKEYESYRIRIAGREIVV